MSIWRVAFVIVAQLALVASALGQKGEPHPLPETSMLLDATNLVVSVSGEETFGAGYTGTLSFLFDGAPKGGSDPVPSLLATTGNDKGIRPFEAQAIEEISGSIDLLGGGVIGGTLYFQVASDGFSTGHDVYATSIAPGGSISEDGGLYEISGLTSNGSITEGGDEKWGTVRLLAALSGLLGEWNLTLDPGGDSPGDMLGSMGVKAVVVPLPSAAYSGLAVLAGAMGLSYVARRR